MFVCVLIASHDEQRMHVRKSRTEHASVHGAGVVAIARASMDADGCGAATSRRDMVFRALQHALHN